MPFNWNDDFIKANTEIPTLVTAIIDNADCIELAFSGGSELVEFIKNLDLQHPDIPHVLNQIFHSSQQAQELLELVGKCKHLFAISRNFHKLLDYKLSKVFLKESFAIRLFKSAEARAIARANKSKQSVDMRHIYNKGFEFWNRQPADFEIFKRNNMPYIEELMAIEDQAARYAELGCQSMKNKIDDNIQHLKEAVRERYFGFNRITISRAALILAKMHGYKFKTTWDTSDNKISGVVDPNGDIYGACVYQFLELQPSNEIQKVVDYLDNFPGVGGKPIFDNYLGLVCSAQHRPILLGEKDNKCYFICEW